MDYLEYLKKLNEEEINDFIKERIKQLEEWSIDNNSNSKVLGYDVEEDFSRKLLDDDTFNINFHCFYNGYIPKKIKLVFGLSYDASGYIGNDGKYYYLDEDSYINDFCMFIKNKDIKDELELFDNILEFIESYFGMNEKIIYNDNSIIPREYMFQMLYDTDYSFYKPYREHGISWFKNKGNALCSEYSIIANNIMNFMGIDSYLVLGCQKVGNERVEGHAYNIISYDEKDSGVRINALIDYADYVCRLNSDYEIIGESPFIGKLREFNLDFLRDFILAEKHLVFNDYSLMNFKDSTGCMAYERKRDYYIDRQLRLEEVKKNKQKIGKDVIMNIVRMEELDV